MGKQESWNKKTLWMWSSSTLIRKIKNGRILLKFYESWAHLDGFRQPLHWLYSWIISFCGQEVTFKYKRGGKILLL